MAITIELPPEVESHLAALAQVRGIDLQTCAQSLLVAAISSQPTSTGVSFEKPEDLEEFLRGMSQFSHKIPLLPDEAFNRENIYQDHD